MSKWAVVTGATAGIGESFTRILASDGFNIVLVARDLERMKERAAHLESQFKVQTAIIQADLATDDGCAKVEKYLRENQIEVLINNAGFGINKAFSVSDVNAEQQLLDVLVRTPMRLMHTVIPQMKERNSGSIINVSWGLYLFTCNRMEFCASKQYETGMVLAFLRRGFFCEAMGSWTLNVPTEF